MLNKLKAAVGIGGAKVDTVLDTHEVVQGGVVTGKVVINGGKVEQKANTVKLKLMTQAKHDGEDGEYFTNHCIARYDLTDEFVIEAGEDYELEFELPLHPEAPVTQLAVYNNKCPVWIETEIDIDMAIDPSDRDHLAIYPAPVVQRVIEAVQEAGFTMSKADVEAGNIRGLTESGCYQEIEFKGNGWTSQEVEFTFVMGDGVVNMIIEKDRLFGGDQYFEAAIGVDTEKHEIESYLASIL